MFNQIKKFFSLLQQTFRSPLFDYVASLTLTTLLGAIPLLLLLVFCIYHTPYLNIQQSHFEQFFFHPLNISETADALNIIKNNLPVAIQFSWSTLLYLGVLCAFFTFFIANTLCKITNRRHPLKLGIKIFFLTICTMIAATTIPSWTDSAFALLLIKALFFTFLMLAILKDHPTSLILKTVTLTLLSQSILSHLFISFYSASAVYHIIYGQIAGFIILISWIYFSWAIIAFFLYIHTKNTQ